MREKTIIPLNLGKNSYDIIFEHGCLKKANEYLNLERKVLVVTDSGVPSQYSDTIVSLAKSPVKVCIPQGEQSKCFDNYKLLLETMLENNFTRTDCVVAVGGGVVGDLSGFTAASYMRGIDFYNIPTTVLSQVDSSIGGKTAIDLGKIKNIVGAFFQPKKVLIDPETLKTLDKRQISNGLSEAVKMSLTFDAELFELFENENIEENLDDIIIHSLNSKKNVVEQDEKEKGLRKVLNFGHTVGHAIESAEDLHNLYHGECVALGMVPMCGDAVRPRLIKVLKKLNLPTEIDFDCKKVCEAVVHDKKFDGENVTIILVNQAGSFEMKKVGKEEIIEMIHSLGGLK